MPKIIATFIFISFFLLSCQKEKAEQCEQAPLESLSLNDLKTWINEHPSYKLEKADCSQSSWIIDLEFYYCGNNYGYLYLSTSSKEYVYEGVSYGLWEAFKLADSKGGFYNSNIKGRYKRLP